jgi:hypothetical protein
MRDPTWLQIFKESLAKRGRCPPFLREALSAVVSIPKGTSSILCLEQATSGLFVRQRERTTRERLSPVISRNSRIKISTQLTDLNGMPRLLRELTALEPDFTRRWI